MPAPLPEHFTFTYPRRSSDFCLRAEHGARAVFGVADMIGHPQGLRWRNYMHVMNRHLGESIASTRTDDIGALVEEVCGHLLWHSRQIHNLRVAHDKAAFGFCLAMAVMIGSECRVLSLGDCRAYRIRRGGIGPASGERQFEVRCMTRDHNALGDVVAREGVLTLFQTEMVEQTKRLGAFLGLDNDDLVARILHDAVVPVDLTPDDCLLLVTDGIYMPHLRAQMDSANFRLTRDMLYLEPWFEHVMRGADRRIPEGEFNYWPEMATILVEETLRHAGRRRQYLDDMAVTGIYLAPPA